MVFLPVGLIQGVLSTASGILTRYVGALPLVFAGIAVMALSFFLASRFTVRTPHSAIMAVVYLRGFGMGLTFAPLNAFSLRNLNQNQMAAAAGISNSIKQLAGSISIALLTAVMTSRIAYHTAHDAGDRDRSLRFGSDRRFYDRRDADARFGASFSALAAQAS